MCMCVYVCIFAYMRVRSPIGVETCPSRVSIDLSSYLQQACMGMRTTCAETRIYWHVTCMCLYGRKDPHLWLSVYRACAFVCLCVHWLLYGCEVFRSA